jgi:cytochrome b involved in lipid metabolism
LNIEEFGTKHPGGAFMIDNNVGRDVSKFFYGGYAMSGNTTSPGDYVPRIQHSNYARYIASDLAIGRLVK